MQEIWDSSPIPGSGRSPGEGHGNPLQYSCLENPMDRGAWWATFTGSQRVRHGWSNFASSHTSRLGISRVPLVPCPRCPVLPCLGLLAGVGRATGAVCPCMQPLAQKAVSWGLHLAKKQAEVGGRGGWALKKPFVSQEGTAAAGQRLWCNPTGGWGGFMIPPSLW